MKLTSPIETLKKSIAVFFKKENLVYFIKIYALLFPFALFFLFQDRFIKIPTGGFNVSEASQILSGAGWLIWLSIPIGLAYLVISFWISAAGIKAVANVLEGLPLDFRQTLSFTWKKLLMFSLLSIVVGLIISLGFVLLIIPGIIFLVWYRFSSFEFMTKDAGIGASLSGSKKLIAGRFWPVLGRMIVFGIFGMLLQIVFGLIPLNLGSLVQPFFGALFILPYFFLYKELSSGGSPGV